MTLTATLVLSSAVFASDSFIAEQNGVNVVSAATNTAPAPAPTTKPTPKPTTTKPDATKPAATGLLQLGSKGDAVVQLQNLLNKNGFTLTADGIFGKQTLAAVISFQTKNGLKADGIVDALTLAKLNPVVAAPAPTPAPAPAPAPAKAPGIYPNVVSSASVLLTTEKELQNSLGAKGTWITTIAGDVTVANNLVWTGDVRKEGATAPARKLGIYYHSSPNIGGEQVFTLKVPTLVVQAENANLAYGTLDGNVDVQAKGFKLTNCTITGNLRFMTQEQYNTASFNDIVIKGDVYVDGNKLSSALKPQTITGFAKYSEAASSGDMIKASVTFKDGKAHDVLIDVMGPAYFMKQGILSSGGQGNWGKVAFSKAGQYVMQKPTADRPADTIFAWDKQISTLIGEYKKAGFDISKFPTFAKDASHPSALDFNKLLGGKYSAYTVSSTNGAIDATKLKGAERSAAVKVDAITSCSVDVGKYLNLVDSIIKAGTK